MLKFHYYNPGNGYLTNNFNYKTNKIIEEKVLFT